MPALILTTKTSSTSAITTILNNNGFKTSVPTPSQICVEPDLKNEKIQSAFWMQLNALQRVNAVGGGDETKLKEEKIGYLSESQVLRLSEDVIRRIAPHEEIVCITAQHSHALSSVTSSALWDGWLVGPIGQIRDYFGENVAFYPAWMLFYNTMLLSASALGLAVYAARPASITVADSPLMPFYALFMVIWASLFPILWRRRASALACDFGTLGYMNEREKIESEKRSEFYGEERKSPITGEIEVYFSSSTRAFRQCVGALITLSLLGVAAMIMVGSLNLQGYIPDEEDPLHVSFLHGLLDANGNWFFLPPILHSICVAILNSIYCKIAEKLTDWENWKTHGEHADSLVLKRFTFEALDCYLPLIYLVFVRLDVDLLRTELISLYIADEARRIVIESLIPTLLLWFGKEKEKEEYDSFDDYLETVIQYGYVVLFAAAFPLAPILSLLGNLIEMRSDIYGLKSIFQRPIPRQAEGTGRWEKIIEIMSFIAIPTNCFIFGFASDQIEAWFPWMFRGGDGRGFEGVVAGQGRYVVIYIIAIEHVLVLLAMLMRKLISNTSVEVDEREARCLFLAKSMKQPLLRMKGDKKVD